MSTTTATRKTDKKTYSLGKFTVPVLDFDEARKPAYAWVGIADLVIEQAKDVPGDVQARAKKLQGNLPGQVKGLPSQAVSNVKKARTSTQQRVTQASDKANARYSDLVVRGEKLITKVRRQQTTQDAIAEGRRAVQKAEAAAANAKRSAKAAAKAATGATDKLG